MNEAGLSEAKGVGAGRSGSLFRLAVLVSLWGWMFWPEITQGVRGALGQSDTVHLGVLPAAILLLVIARHKEFREALGRGSVWGVVIAAGGVLLFASLLWPFSFGYLRQMSLVVVLAGLIAAANGMTMLKRCLPILVLMVLAIPVGQRLYASLIIRPETYTLQATAVVVDQLPGLKTMVRGKDILYTRSGKEGAVALGESNRGARLFMGMAFLGAWVAFYRRRSLGRLLFVAIAGVVILLLCNGFRLLTWALAQIYIWPDPVNPWPRSVSGVMSLIAAYGLFVVVSSIRVRLFVEEEGPPDPGKEGKEEGHE